MAQTAATDYRSSLAFNRPLSAITRRWNTSRKSPRADMIAVDTPPALAVIILGAFDEEKAPATYGRHAATSVQWLRIPIRPHERRKGKHTADDASCQTF